MLYKFQVQDARDLSFSDLSKGIGESHLNLQQHLLRKDPVNCV